LTSNSSPAPGSMITSPASWPWPQPSAQRRIRPVRQALADQLRSL